MSLNPGISEPAEPATPQVRSQAQRSSGRAPARGMCRVLVVDDDFGIRSALVALLEDEGNLVEEATNGAEALTCLERQPATVVLLDMRMPVMDGWTFAQELRARGLSVPVVVMTAARDARRWAEEIAAAAFVTKPFDYDALLTTLDGICNEQRQH
jgi:CheY-like chemotaxis protein